MVMRKMFTDVLALIYLYNAVAAKVGIKSYTELHKGVTELHRKKALCETPWFPVFPDVRKEKTFTHQTKEYCSS
jgi:hypothetical protein